MRREELSDLSVFLAVAEECSFTRAATRMGTSQSAISQIVRRLETNMGVKLLTRTTRNVVPTAAGEPLVETLRPAFDDIDARLSALSALRERPSVTIRLTTRKHAAETLLWSVIRMPTKVGLYAWEFEKDGRELQGIACVMEDQAAPYLADGRLVRLLDAWSPSFAGYHLYYPDRRQLPPAFAILVAALRRAADRASPRDNVAFVMRAFGMTADIS